MPKPSNLKKSHPWRICPAGKHWVSEHPRHISNGVTQVEGHCRTNPSRKDQIYAGELLSISSKYFGGVSERPKADNLDFKYLGNRYDELIAGWTKYWNEVLEPSDPLDPNLVKALIATESSFKREASVFAGK